MGLSVLITTFYLKNSKATKFNIIPIITYGCEEYYRKGIEYVTG